MTDVCVKKDLLLAFAGEEELSVRQPSLLERASMTTS